MRYYRVIALLALLLVFVGSAAFGQAAGVKYKGSGVFVDSGGGQHAWTINDAHTLIWDGAPYIPVGGVFDSRYLSLEATDENYQADIKALDLAKSKGITDIILRSTGPLTSVNPAALQKMVDYLDAGGFTYGIELNDGPREPLSGYLIAPNRYRIEGPTTQSKFVCDWPDTDSAIYLVVLKYDNRILDMGGAIVKDGKVTVTLADELGAGQVLIVYPHKTFRPVAQGGQGDLWSGFSEYRDRLLAFFKQVKFGPGLRFFCEPFTSKMDFTGDMAGFVPDSAGFRIGFEAYLTRRRVHEGSVNSAWGLGDNLDKIETAARLIPLWFGSRGVPYAYDRASAHRYPVDISVTSMWRDLSEYRDLSALEYMNTIADTLKKNVANVPVIFKTSNYHRIYANPYGIGGFDGLGAVAYGTGDTGVVKAAGPVYSLAEESAKTTWFVIAATQTAAARKTFVGYTDETTLAATLDSFREVGAKGIFVDSLQALPEDTRGGFSLVREPQQLEWLRRFKDKFAANVSVDFKPTVLNYPAVPPVGAGVRRLMPNTWWLPTLKTGKATYIGDGLFAYAIAAEDKVYMWSSVGPRTITLKPSLTGTPSIVFPEGAKLAAKKGGLVSVTLTDVPTVVRGLDISLVFPVETAEAAIAKLRQTIPIADKAALDVKKARSTLESAQTVLKNGQPMIAYGMAQTSLQELMNELGADTWIEGESSPAHNFDGLLPVQGASNAQVLLLDTDDSPPLMPYTAMFAFEANANSSYEIWLAATPPADGCPMSYTLDDVIWNPVTPIDGTLQTYASGLAWYKVGSANLFPGKHWLKLRANSRRPQDNRYYFAVDAIVLSPRGFKPNGVVKP